MQNKINDGLDLEKAVRFLEQISLNQNPNLKLESIKITPRKIETIEGVKHEVDLYVELTFDKNYSAKYLFECKDTKETIGKNEIIIFEEKINAFSAQKGFFVAKRFSKYAKEQAKKSKRIDLLNFTKEVNNILNHTPITTFLIKGFSIEEIKIQTSNSNYLEIENVENETCVYLENEINLKKFLFQVAKSLYNEASELIPQNKNTSFTFVPNKDILFKENELFIQNKPVKKIHLKLKMPIKIQTIKPAVKISLKKGHSVQYEPFEFTNLDGKTEKIIINVLKKGDLYYPVIEKE